MELPVMARHVPTRAATVATASGRRGDRDGHDPAGTVHLSRVRWGDADGILDRSPDPLLPLAAAAQAGQCRPTFEGIAFSKDVWMFGIGLSLLADAIIEARRHRV
jgi:hypothetical protein